METLFCIFGCVAILALLIIMTQAKMAVKMLNTHQKEPDNEEEKKEWATHGCMALIVYTWFLWGLFTSQWFICAVYLSLGIIEAVVKQLIRYERRTVTGYIIGIAVDCLVVLFIILNSLWLHIDVYHLIF